MMNQNSYFWYRCYHFFYIGLRSLFIKIIKKVPRSQSLEQTIAKYIPDNKSRKFSCWCFWNISFSYDRCSNLPTAHENEQPKLPMPYKHGHQYSCGFLA
jgi:hypothetical protein